MFSSDVAVIDETNRDRVASTWRPECPVGLDQLRLVTMSHWNEQGEAVSGELVLHRDHVEAVITVFGRLFDARFPIERMTVIDAYDGDDGASMRANNTSAFNCREIDGRPGVWSQHAYGGAVDINPLVNPWVRGERVDPPEGAAYVDRRVDVPGLIVAGDVVTTAFGEVGWGWGGDWDKAKDYQHFSWNGG
ncbi:MAG: M15 family metallopeptidase [Acidimicrobiales bacterium]